MAMDKFRRTPKVFLLWFIILSHQIILSALSDEQGGARYSSVQEKPYSIAKILTDTISILRKSHKSSWEKVKTIIYEMQSQFYPPSLDFRAINEADAEFEDGAASVAGKKMKEAATKSTRKSKMVVEESAKSAAEAVYKTAEKMKEVVSDDKEKYHHDEV